MTPLLVACAATGRLECLDLTYDAARRYYAANSPSKAEKSLRRCVNRRNTYGQTPLMLACKHGQARAVSWLLGKGGDPMLFDSIHSRACLHYCALYGQSGCVVREISVLGLGRCVLRWWDACLPEGRFTHSTRWQVLCWFQMLKCLAVTDAQTVESTCMQEALFQVNVLVESVDGLQPLSQAHIVDSQGIHKCARASSTPVNLPDASHLSLGASEQPERRLTFRRYSIPVLGVQDRRLCLLHLRT